MTKPTSKWIFSRAIVLTVIVLGLLIKVNNGGSDNHTAKIESEKARISERALRREAGKIWPNNSTRSKFSYERRKGFRESSNRNALVGELAVYAVAEELNATLALPFDIQILFAQCGEPDSFYDDEAHKIVICYELFDAYDHLFSRTLKMRTSRDGAIKGAIVSMFLHEVAHALIDGWDLPITGREEDAGDQFSTLM